MRANWTIVIQARGFTVLRHRDDDRFLKSSQVKSSHLYLYSAFNNTDCVKALNSIKLEDRMSVMYNNKIKHSIFT